MKLSELKSKLDGLETIRFQLPNGEFVPPHFHVTEIGKISKQFIDCGGTLRKEEVINFQLWTADDFDHRLAPQKLIDIIDLSERSLGLEDHEIEVEYQGATIGKYHLGFDNGTLQLLSTQTDCLAREACVVPPTKQKLQLSELPIAGGNCNPGSGCC